MSTGLSHSKLLLLARLTLAAGITLEFTHALFGLGGHGIDSFVKDGVYSAMEVIAVAVCAARVIRRREQRRAWAAITLALAMWTTGDLVWTIWLESMANPPSPSIADVFYLLTYPALYAGVMILLRSHLRRDGILNWLDGAIAGLTLAAAGAELVMPILIKTGTGHWLSDAVNLAYPIGDLAVLAIVVMAFSLAHWRPANSWRWLGAGLVVQSTADLIYVYQNAKGTYVVGGVLDAMWPLSMALLAQAAWQSRRPELRRLTVVPQLIAIPAACGILSLAALVIAAFHRVTPAAVGLAAAAIVVAFVRGLLTYAENVRMLRGSAHQAVTDGLTGLGNRRRLMEDLDSAVAATHDGRAWTIAFFDLDGFKRYNDSFGHGAGDSLLKRLSSSLGTAVLGAGDAYRLGGDEFCVLLHGRVARHDRVMAGIAAALLDHGGGFTVSASYGLAVIPDDAAGASEALQLADQRMYADKARSTHAGRERTRDVLMQVLSERTPGLHEHVSGVGELVRQLGRMFRLDSDQLDELLRAGELHDIGKLAVPDEILNKAGPLNETEWQFMRQHSIVGERILNADPALRPVARLVRSSHERWDGGGYPDGLAGAAIPLGARIIAACDAYEAMTSERCYQTARSPEEAIAELRRTAGTQFDPDVVRALVEVLETPRQLGGSRDDDQSRTMRRALQNGALPAGSWPEAKH